MVIPTHAGTSSHADSGQLACSAASWLLRQFAAQTGQMLNISKAGQAAGLESSTANRYATLLEAAFMIQRLPAWGTTLGKRIAAYPKVHVIDSGLAGWLLGLSAAKASSRDPAALTEFGHLVETFAAGEILKQVSWSEEAVTAAYFRTRTGTRLILCWRPGTAASPDSK